METITTQGGVYLETATFAKDVLITQGAGVAALLLFFLIIIFVIWKLPSFLKVWRETETAMILERQLQTKTIAELSSTSIEVIRANTLAYHDNGQSNLNMAKALELLTVVIERSESEAKNHDERMTKQISEYELRMVKIISDHDIRVQAMNLTLATISERTSAWRTRSTDVVQN